MKTEDYQEEINQIQYEIEKKNIDFSNNYELKIDIEIFNLFISKNVYKEKFIDLINLIDSNEHILDKNIIKYYYYHLRNYCSKLIIFGKYELYPVLNQIYFNHLQKGYLFQDGKILGIIYLNIVNTALKSGDQEWAIKFCEEYKDNIWGNERITNEIYELSLANYYYHTKNFDKAYQILPKHSNDSEINLIIRRLEIRILFETHSDLLPFKIDAFKMYISRSAKNIISESNRVRQSGFINLVLQLTQCTWRDYEKAEKIRQRILAKPQVSERQWLLEMVDNILATRKS